MGNKASSEAATNRSSAILPLSLTALTLIAGVSYMWLLHSPWVRNTGLPNSAVMVVATTAGVHLATRRRTRMTCAAAAVSLFLTVTCVWGLYLRPLPQPTGGPDVATKAPDFALVDSRGETIRLAGIRGPVLLVFYRGWW